MDVTVEEIHWGEQGRLQQVIVDVVEFDQCVVDDYGLVREYYVIEPTNPTEFTINRAVTRARLNTRRCGAAGACCASAWAMWW